MSCFNSNLCGLVLVLRVVFVIGSFNVVFELLNQFFFVIFPISLKLKLERKKVIIFNVYIIIPVPFFYLDRDWET